MTRGVGLLGTLQPTAISINPKVDPDQRLAGASFLF